MREVIAQLEGLRRRGWCMLYLQRFAVVLAWTASVTIAVVLLDYGLRLPAAVRAVLLAGGVAALIVSGWRYLLPALRFRPTLTQIALRVERALPALSGRLASSIEFAVSGVDQTNPLAARSVREAQSRIAGESIRKVIEPRPTVRDLAILVLVALLGAFFLFNHPASAQTGLSRLFLPFGDAKWPARTGVESLMHEVVSAPGAQTTGVHPRGQTLPLRAKVTRGEASSRVDARYRARVDGVFQSWQHVVLTQQGSSFVHERLIDTSGGADLIELHFSTQDDQTRLERIAIVTPPAVRRASLHVSPPDYAAGLVLPLEVELGPGIDARARTETPSLVGSDARLDLHLNKALPVPPEADTQAREQWLRTTLDWDDDANLPSFHFDPNQPTTWTLEWNLERTFTLPLHLLDEHGLSSAESIAYRIDVVADAPPSVTITRPQADEAVLATALVSLVGEAQDDVGIRHVALEARLMRGDEARNDEPLWSSDQPMAPPDPAANIRADLDLSTLPLSEGDVLVITGVAHDVYEAEGEARPPTRSAPRRLRIISELELEMQVRRQLGAIRQSAIRMEAQQAELQESDVESGLDAGMERAQAQVTERLAEQRRAVDQIGRLLRDNRMDHAQIESLLQQSADLLDYAGRASASATSTMAQQRQFGETEERAREITEHQQDVREELTDLIALLDRDEDSWVVTRQLEGLLQDQAELHEETAQLGERTMGRSLADLPQRDLTELDRIAQRQRELRDRARQLGEELRRRAEQIEPVDPNAAAAMRDAARTATQRELDRDMDQAAQRAEQNQMRNAQRAQQNATETMQRMLEDIQQTQRARAEQLIRQLASLVESIQRLVVVQENELIALANARHRESFAGRDTAMIRLNQNTRAVAAEARGMGQETRRIARMLDRAADAQGTAITALRATPLRVDEAEDAENRSLDLLNEAKALAEELERQMQEEEAMRRREELLNSYRQFAERQIVLRDQTVELQELQRQERFDRRQVVEARRLGSQQDEIRTGLLDLQRATNELLESIIFSHVHARIDALARKVSESLDEGDVGMMTTERQTTIAESIGRLIEALEETPPIPEEFDTGEGQGSAGGGGSPPLIPPVAELRLLRGMQEQVYNQTRLLDSRTDLNDAERRDRLRDTGGQQRELIDIGRQMLEALERNAPPASPE